MTAWIISLLPASPFPPSPLLLYNEREKKKVKRERERKRDTMPEKAMDEVMEAAAGAHFSGLRLDSLRLPIHSDPSSPSSARAATFHHGGELDSIDNHLQHFHIGSFKS